LSTNKSNAIKTKMRTIREVQIMREFFYEIKVLPPMNDYF